MGTTNQKISIIIPAYNHRQALQRCLVSIGAQTYKDFEVIVVDDGSTDGTTVWLKGQSNIQAITQENRGAPAARNRGLKEARGEYLLFCDADVTMQPQMLERMMRTLAEHAEASYVYSSFKFGWKTFRLFPFDGEKLKRMPYIHSTSLIRRSDFPTVGWDESLKRFQDWDLWLTMLEEGHRGVWISDILFTVQTRTTGYSSWLPSFLYKLPWLPSVVRYEQAKRIIITKHHL